MKTKITFYWIMLFINISVNAQNFINNYSFEQYTQCPDNLNEISYSIGWKSYYATPEYYNVCATNPNVSVPHNAYGSYQLPLTGVAYAGFYAYWSPIYGNGHKNIREHIGRQLASPLVIGTKYYVSFKVSLADNSATMGSANCACNNLGIKFSTMPYNIYADSANSSPLVNNFAHIFETTLITDTVNWTTVAGSFIADSAYDYLIIANFFKDANTDTLLFKPSQIYCFAYYYVDDVCISTDALTCGLTDISEIQLENAIKIFPNPFCISTTIEIDDKFKFNICEAILYNILGVELKHYEMKNSELTIERDDLPEGMYFLKINIDKQFFTQKLIITNLNK